MPRLSAYAEEIVDIPTNVSVNKKGYVYYNADTYWTDSKDMSHKYAGHTKVCIGKILIPGSDWAGDPRMHPNSNYYRLFDVEKLPVMPERADSISVGVITAVTELSASYGLTEVLVDSFGEDDACLVLDLAMYMLIQESAVFQHFPHWARSHALFSETIRSDSYISVFERENLTISKINLFKTLWARKTLNDGKVFFCYDSTNSNSQAEGVFLVEKGHAKDDPSLCQVNTDYVVRQSDGLPVTFTVFPGSINDMAEASEMIAFFEKLLGDGKAPEITLVSDRGYISEENVFLMDGAGVGFLLMLRRNMGITDAMLEVHAPEVKSSANYVEDRDQYASTFEAPLFDRDTKIRYFHIVWDPVLESRHRRSLYAEVANAQERIRKLIERKTLISEEEAKRYGRWFSLDIQETGTLQVRKKGRGKGTKTIPAFIIRSADKNTVAIDHDLQKCGYYVLVTSAKMTAREALYAYSKRDCVEKVFMALKSFLGMNKLGTQTDEGIHAKSLIWFVAAILHSLLFIHTEQLRFSDRKTYTVPSVIDLLEEIAADKNLTTLKYERRYKPNKKQSSIIHALSMSVADIDERISNL